MTTAVPLDDHAYESAKECSAALGQSVTDWLTNAVGAAARRQSTATYVAWERANYHDQGFDRLDEATAAASLDGADW